MRYLIIDANNLIQRAVHVIKATPDHQEWMARAYAIIFQSIAKMAGKFKADHCVCCFDSRSWREEIYGAYKENRKFGPGVNELKVETKKVSHAVLHEFVRYLRDKTNITVLEGDRIEADDFVARWVQRHQESTDTNIIVSNDADFKQLVGPGIDLYDPIPCILYTSDGVYFQDDKRDVTHPTAHRYGEIWKIRYAQPKTTMVYRYRWEEGDKGQKGSSIYPTSPHPMGDGIGVFELTGIDEPIRVIRIVGHLNGWEYLSDTQWLTLPVLSETYPLLLWPYDRVRFIQKRETFNPQWELFRKCIRGDSRDNIKPSFLKVPETRMEKAFTNPAEYVKLINDSFGKGPDRQDVRPRFELNQKLIDLTAQPQDIIDKMDGIIDTMISEEPKQLVEIYFDDFCAEYQSRRLRDIKSTVLPVLSKPYRR